MDLNGTDLPPCGPGNTCPTRFIGCQQVCPKMIKWKARQEAVKAAKKKVGRGSPDYSQGKAIAAHRRLMEKKGGRHK